MKYKTDLFMTSSKERKIICQVLLSGFIWAQPLASFTRIRSITKRNIPSSVSSINLLLNSNQFSKAQAISCPLGVKDVMLRDSSGLLNLHSRDPLILCCAIVFVYEMDLETENRIAAVLMKEAAELRRQAARDGIDAYLRPSNVRGRPNSRFLTATVLGVQQSNRAVEVNEMWRAREKEKEMNNRSKKDEKRGTYSDSKKNTSTRFEDYERKHSSLCSSSKSAIEGELRDNEIEEFLHSRVKRGRGTVGSRMDETGPYLPESEGKINLESPTYMGHRAAILGPEKPLNFKSNSSSDEESSSSSEERDRRAKRSKRHCSKSDKSIDKKKKKKKKKVKREKKRSKHHK
ncbi:hypothetical protein QVD17_05807 [Tagetes erecta]|uniref:Uncharacterized protein n=1 Tax=Tagetes erecta TaxID=13708 RepID=A0AAD8PBS1_TARER|nr:hypothetical protein QVD17_05807 [Tagetes erecta]